MGLPAMHTLICPAKGADPLLDTLYKAEDHPLLPVAGMAAHWAKFADAGQRPVNGGSVLTAHLIKPFPTVNA